MTGYQRGLFLLIVVVGALNLNAVVERPHDPMNVFNLIALAVCAVCLIGLLILSRK